MKDLARETGLGLATISSYFNGGNVREKNRIKIEAAIEKLHYEVNEMARGLKTNATKTIGVVIPELNNTFCAEIITEMEDIFRNQGYATIVCDCRTDPSLEYDSVSFLLRKRVDGLINFPVNGTGEHLRAFLRSSKPVVVIDRLIEEKEVDTILVDNRRAAEDAVKLFLQNGHTEIGIITGPNDVFTARERLLGYQTALENAGKEVNPSLIYQGEYTIADGVKGLQTLCDNNPNMTAVFIANYELTLGAIIKANERGILVPQQLSMIGFDSLTMAKACRPTLTVVVQPTKEIARRAAECMLTKLKGETIGEARIQRLPAAIALGGTVRNLRKRSG